MSASTVPYTEINQEAGRHHVHLRRFLRAPRERVFAAWVEPEQMKRWHGPEGWETLDASSDPRPGGDYRFTMRGMTQPTDPHEEPRLMTGAAYGKYLEVRPPELLRFTWNGEWMQGETTVTVRLTEADGGTMLELTHEGFTSEREAKGHDRGWSGSLPKLAALVEQGKL